LGNIEALYSSGTHIKKTKLTAFALWNADGVRT